jgi:hypothetical protein
MDDKKFMVTTKNNIFIDLSGEVIYHHWNQIVVALRVIRIELGERYYLLKKDLGFN